MSNMKSIALHTNYSILACVVDEFTEEFAIFERLKLYKVHELYNAQTFKKSKIFIPKSSEILREKNRNSHDVNRFLHKVTYVGLYKANMFNYHIAMCVARFKCVKDLISPDKWWSTNEYMEDAVFGFATTDLVRDTMRLNNAETGDINDAPFIKVLSFFPESVIAGSWVDEYNGTGKEFEITDDKKLVNIYDKFQLGLNPYVSGAGLITGLRKLTFDNKSLTIGEEKDKSKYTYALTVEVDDKDEYLHYFNGILNVATKI